MVSDFNDRMTAAVAGVANSALNAAGELVNAVTGLGDLYTAAGLNPGVQDRTGRVVAAAAAATTVFGEGERAAARLTSSQAGDLARYLGYEKRVKDAPINSMGQHVFTNGKNLITQDITMHRGPQATWKMFTRDGSQRLGTFTWDLSTRMGP